MIDPLTIKELSTKSGLSIPTIYRRLKNLDQGMIKVKIQKRKGKATLFDFSLIDVLIDPMIHPDRGKQINTLSSTVITTEIPLSKECDTPPDQTDRPLIDLVKKFETEISELKSTVKKKDDYIIEMNQAYRDDMNKLTDQIAENNDLISDMSNRHDSIVMTMSNQLMAMTRNILLLESKPVPVLETGYYEKNESWWIKIKRFLLE